MSRSRRVVLTGLGVVSPLGIGLPSLLDSLRQGRSGIRRITAYDPSALPVQIAGEVVDFDARQFLDKKDRKSLKMMARTVQFAVAASRLALDDSRLRLEAIDPNRFGVVFGMSTIPGDLTDLGPGALASFDAVAGQFDLVRWGQQGLALLPPMWMLNHVPNMATCHVSILHNARGPINTVTQYDAGGLLAVGEAAQVIQRDAADFILAGGADTRCVLIGQIRHTLFGQLSLCPQPEKACRPFDLDRDGQVTAEGGCVLVVEELEHARRRQARIHAEVLGFASGFDRGRSGAGLSGVINLTLERAGVAAAELDHVNCHAPGTREDDAWEARGLNGVRGLAQVPVLALKSYTGNLGSPSNTLELAASVACLEEGWRAGTLNYDHADPECRVEVLREPTPARHTCFLKISTTAMGHCAAMVLRVGEV